MTTSKPASSQLDKFLYNYRTKDNETPTHTKIGNKELKIFGGCYTIPEKDMEKFYKIYHNHVFVKKHKAYMTERQLSTGPIAIDLDFRYSKDVKEKQHDESHLYDLVDLFINKIKSIIEIEEDFNIYVFEKDKVNTSGQDVTKDGIHFIVNINVDRATQCLLRDEILSEINCVLEDLPLTNSYDSVYDDGVTKGTVPWQLYGSRKPKHHAYKLKKIYNYNFDSSVIHTETVGDNTLKLLKDISVRNKKNNYCIVNDEFKQKYDAVKEKMNNKNSGNNVQNSAPTVTINGDAMDLEDINSIQALNEKVENYVNSFPNEEYIIKETYRNLKLLTPEYYDNYDKWIKVGWALKNTDNKLFLLWMDFSSRSSKFNLSDISEHYTNWKRMRRTSCNYKCLSYKSISYWAKECNPVEYEKNYQETLKYLIEMCTTNSGTSKKAQGSTEYDVAKIMHYIWGDKFKCASISKKLWYYFDDHKWTITDGGHGLRSKISGDLAKMFIANCQEVIAIMHSVNLEDEEMNNALRIKSASYAEITRQVKNTRFKDNVMKECNELFYDKDFLDNIDRNPYLLCYSNGVVDIKNQIFRDGKPEDYITMSTNINYVPMKKIMKNEEMKKNYDSVVKFFTQLFPKKPVYNYMLDHLASILIGTNENQTFTLYVGTGRNGKSKLVELMEKVLGDYKGTVPITLVTSKRNSIGSTSPEVAQLQGKRYAVMQEPSKGDIVNEGIMKELTGGDPIQARPLYRDSIVFTPQFTLAVCTNNLFEFKSNDDGTWRRIRIVDFISEFRNEDDIDPNKPYQFPIDKKINEKFEEWAPILSSLLVERVFETQGLVKDCEEVTRSSYQYREDQDYITQFCNERIVKDDTGTIKQMELMQEFGMWYESLYGKKGRPKNKDIKSHIERHYFNGERGAKWKGIRLVYSGEMDEEE